MQWLNEKKIFSLVYLNIAKSQKMSICDAKTRFKASQRKLAVFILLTKILINERKLPKTDRHFYFYRIAKHRGDQGGT